MSVITWEVGAIPVGGRLAPSRPAPSRTVTRRTATGRPAPSRAAALPGTRLRLTRRGRLVTSALALVLAAGFTFSAQGATAGAGQEATEVVAYTVAAGDTLWAIAGSVAEPGQDRREVVDRIIAINGLAGGDLTAGQLLIVPAP